MSTVGFGVAITLADMFTPKLKQVGKGVMGFNAKLAATSTLAAGIGKKLWSGMDRFYDSFGEVAQKQGDLLSLDADTKGVELITEAGLKFANTWSHTVVKDFTGAAYDIKSGISSLSDHGVAEMTRYSALTAKATKAQIATMTNLFTKGYGIFRGDFSSDLDFGQKFSAMISATVKLYQTEGEDLGRAISTLGGIAQKYGVQAAEELSVLGESKSSFGSASEGATTYRAVLVGAYKAQKDLGLSFVDSHNKLLPLNRIMDKLHKKFGKLDAKEMKKIKDAWGSDEALKLISLLIDRGDALREKQKQIEDAAAKGIGYTTQMAKAREYGQEASLLGDQLNSLSFIIGELLSPAMGWVSKKFGSLVTWTQAWTKEHKSLADTLATGMVVFAGLATLLGTLGVGIAGISFGMSALGISFSGILLVGAPILALVGALAGAGWLVYKNWAKVKAFFSPFFDGMSKGFRDIGKHTQRLVTHLKPIGDLWSWIVEQGSGLVTWFKQLIGLSDEGSGALDDLGSSGARLGRWMTAVFGDLVDIIGVSVRGWVKLIEWSKQIMSTVLSWVPDDILTKAWSGTTKIFDTVVEGWQKLWALGMAVIRGEISWDPSALLSGIWDGLGHIFSTAVEGWKRIISRGMDAIGIELSYDPAGTLAPLWSGTKNIFATSMEGWKQLFSLGIAVIRGEISWDPSALLSGIWGGTKAIFQATVAGWKGILSGFWDWAVGLFKKIMNTIASLGKEIGAAVSSATSAAVDFGAGSGKGHIPLKTFGPHTTPTMTQGSTLKDKIESTPRQPLSVNTHNEKTVHVHEGDIHLSVHGDTDPHRTARLAASMIRAEQRDRADRRIT